jgi:hypothetical protein
VIPMKNQYEQQLNAAALKDMGVPVIKSLKPKHDEKILDWLTNGQVIKVNYPDNTQKVLDMLFEQYAETSYFTETLVAQ